MLDRPRVEWIMATVLPEWVLVVQAFGGPLVAVAGATIAWQQYRLARQQHELAHQKLKLDLYPIRYEIYQTIVDAIVAALNGQYETVLDERTRKLNECVRQSRFVFEPEAFDYFGTLETKILQYRSISRSIEHPSSATASTDLGSMHEWHRLNGQWLLKQLREINHVVKRQMRISDEISSSPQPAVLQREPPPPGL